MKLHDRIDNALEAQLCDVYQELGITRGDITPMQREDWDTIVNNTAALFSELIDQNKEVK